MSRVRDAFAIFRCLTFRRVLNLALLRISYLFSKVIKTPLLLGQPAFLSIEPTTACNLACPECPSGLKQFTRPTGKLDLQFHQSMLNQVSKTVFYINYYFQGEPFLHPQFLRLIKEAKKKHLYTSTSTNAHFIDEQKANEIVDSGLDRLIISIDGLTQESYEQYRKQGSLSKVIEASKYLVQAKKNKQSATPHLIFQFLAVRPNEHEIPAVFELANEIGIDEVRIKTAQLYDYKNGHSLMPTNEHYSRYKRTKNGTYRLKYKTGNHCWRMWSGSVFTWDGRVVPCCFDKDAQHVLGTISTHSFRTIWKSPTYKNMRKAVLKGRNQIDICQNCSEGAKVWA
jgi:radical SAM protein with 4Fe4S-binding SPASM domain